MNAAALLEKRRIWSQQLSEQKKRINILEGILAGRVPYNPSRRPKPGEDWKATLRQSLEDAKRDLKIIEDNEPKLTVTNRPPIDK